MAAAVGVALLDGAELAKPMRLRPRRGVQGAQAQQVRAAVRQLDEQSTGFGASAAATRKGAALPSPWLGGEGLRPKGIGAVQGVSLERRPVAEQQASRTFDAKPEVFMDRRFHARGGRASAIQARPQREEQSSQRKAVQRPHFPFEADVSAGGSAALCSHCSLPLGEWAYPIDSSRGQSYVHGECQAQLLLRGSLERESARRAEAAAARRKRREDFGVGWQAGLIPSGAALASQLPGHVAPGQPCGLALIEDGGARRARLRPAASAAAAVNLEYLALALQVRKCEGREPLFSLEPTASAGGVEEEPMLLKRFEPAWLAGTSVGAVMFQADYHLKELSMGEHQQPVVGLHSCFNWPEVPQGFGTDWRAREWFVVTDAGVSVAPDGMLLPFVKMGVEAREQIEGPSGFEDAKLTRPHHPLVKYAEAFTHYFDLIAERKSVIYHLRELAKASVLAKLLVEDQFELEDAWFGAGRPTDVPAVEASDLRIPQLWNDHCSVSIAVKDGRIDAERGMSRRLRSVYGGVQFGLDVLPRFATKAIAANHVSSAAMTRAMAEAELLVQRTDLSQPISQPLGVDLNLDSISISLPTPPGGNQAHGEAAVLPVAFPGDSYWSAMEDKSECDLLGLEKGLLTELFNPQLSDRRNEGELFMPPNPEKAYVEHLHSLLQEEESTKRCRVEHFLSESFSLAAPGPLFPADWADGTKLVGCGRGRYHTVPDSRVPKLKQMIQSATPDFERYTEDGMCFRIYHISRWEIRTAQDHGSHDVTGAAFLSGAERAPRPAAAAATTALEERCVRGQERIVKVTEYVESQGFTCSATSADSRKPCHYFVVLETECGLSIATELCQDGTVSWMENPQDVEARIALAKVIASADCQTTGVTARDIKRLQVETLARSSMLTPSRSACANYAHQVFWRAAPEPQ